MLASTNAISGKNFCTSAKHAFKLIGAICIRFAVVSGLGVIIHYIGLIFIMTGTCACGYFIFTGLHHTTAPAIPMDCYVILSYAPVSADIFTETAAVQPPSANVAS